MRLRQLTSSLLLCAIPAVLLVSVCRYTVRDVGFVVLDEQPFKLELGASTPALTGRLQNFCRALFLDADVALEAHDLAGATLVDSRGRRLALIGWPQSPKSLGDVQDHIETVVDSKARDQVLSRIADVHGVVVFVEGRIEAQNQRVSLLCKEAIDRAEPVLAELPKKSKQPTAIVRVPWNSRDDERVFLFSMGFETADIDGDDPLVAALYGRGVRMGEPLFGPLITRTAIQENLILIGQDCECGLDRSVMRGQRALLNWTDDQRKAVRAAVDFDPENPMVRAEVSRILSRGRVEGEEDFGDPQAAYSETEIPEGNGTVPTTEPESTAVEVARDLTKIFYLVGAFLGVVVLGAIWLLTRRGSSTL